MFRSVRPPRGAGSIKLQLIALATGVVLALVVLVVVPRSGSTESAIVPCARPSYGAIPICVSMDELPEYRNGSLWVYPFEINILLCPLFIGNFSFSVGPNSTEPAPPWSVSAVSEAGHVLSDFNSSRASWGAGSSGSVEVGMEFVLEAVATLSGHGFIWVADGPDSCGDNLGTILP